MSFDFCLLLSTSSAIPGTPHHVAEAALRRFREAFVYQRNPTSKGDWAYSSLDHGALSPEETEIIFRNLLSLRRATHVYVSQPKPQSCRPESFNPQTPSASSPEIPEGRANIPAANHEIEKRLGHLWQELLGVIQVRAEDNFFELGGDSLIALQLVSRLRDIMKVEVSIADLFERPTLGELAESIAQQLTNGNAHQQPAEFSPVARGDDDLDRLLTQLEQFSDERVQALLCENTESGNLT
jgi:acyl carrier protein